MFISACHSTSAVCPAFPLGRSPSRSHFRRSLSCFNLSDLRPCHYTDLTGVLNCRDDCLIPVAAK